MAEAAAPSPRNEVAELRAAVRALSERERELDEREAQFQPRSSAIASGRATGWRSDRAGPATADQVLEEVRELRAMIGRASTLRHPDAYPDARGTLVQQAPCYPQRRLAEEI